MKLRIYLAGLVILLILPEVAFAFDRMAVHAKRLGDPGRTEREVAPSFFSAPDFSLAAGADWTISESVQPSRFYQDLPNVCALSDNSWLVVWVDERNGTSEIFARKTDSVGILLAPELSIVSAGSESEFVDPRVAVDDQGRIYLFYRDRLNWLIFGSRLDSDLNFTVEPFLVNDTTGSALAGPYDFALYPDGRSVAVWENYAGAGLTIQMKILDSTGQTVLEQTTANSDGGLVSHIVPSVAVDPAGDFLVAWEDYREGPANIYYQFFNFTGGPIGVNSNAVPASSSGFDQYRPEAAFSSSDKYIIGWVDQRDAAIGQHIYIQRLDITGVTGINERISGAGNLTAWEPAFTISSVGRLAAAWSTVSSSSDISLLRFAAGFLPIGSAATVNKSALGQRGAPSVAYNDNLRYAVVWREAPDGDGDISFSLFDNNGAALPSGEQLLNTDSIGAPSIEPDAALNSNGQALIVFTDKRRDDGDICLQVLGSDGELIGNNVLVNLGFSGSLQKEPAIAVADKSLVVWYDTRQESDLPGRQLFGRFASAAGIFTENEFLITDTSQATVFGSPKAAMNSNGRALVAWTDSRGTKDSLQIYGRWLDNSGKFLSDVFAISDSLDGSHNLDLSLATDSSGRFYAIWRRELNDSVYVGVNQYSADGAILTNLFRSSPWDSVTIGEISAVTDQSGKLYIAWVGKGTDSRLYLTVMSDINNPLVDISFSVSDDLQSRPSEPSLAVADDGYVSVTWIDRRLGRPSAFRQLFNDDFSTDQNNQPVSSAAPEFMRSPQALASDGRAWYVWSDPRADGLNIFANNYFYMTVDVNESDDQLLPSAFRLHQNYPNPFNPETELQFSVPEKAYVTLSVYNLLGRQVKLLADGLYPAGRHSVRWNGRDDIGRSVASGVYFYRLEAGDITLSRKMLLVK